MSEVRARIVVEATRLFAERGFAATSVRSIVEASGVSKPTLYYHFGDKEGLFRALVETHLQNWVDRLAEVTQGPGTVRERLHGYVHAAIGGSLKAPEVLHFLAQALNRAREGKPLVDGERFLVMEARLLDDLFAEGVEGGELRGLPSQGAGLALMGMVHWHVAASIHGGPPLRPETADLILDIFLNGVLP